MKKISKKLTDARKKIDSTKFYTLEEGIKLAKEASYENFDATIDLAFKLNLDVRQADQQLRGSLSLPHGTGKKVRVLAIVDNETQMKEAKEVGAEIVAGKADVTEILNANKFEFDVIVTEPKMMPILGKYGKVLGPKGLMPNPKTGTVTPMVAKAVAEIKRGKANYRTDKNGIIHTIIGKKSIESTKLIENANHVISTILKLKPTAVKGTYLQTLTLATTMGPGIKIKVEK